MLSRLSIVFIVVALCLPQMVRAQETSGTVQGVVHDSRGAAVPAAEVAVRVGTCIAHTTTDNSGKYLLHCTPGVAQIDVGRGGFRSAEDQVAIPPGGAVELDFVLSEATSTSVNVIGRTSSAGSSATLNTTTSALFTLPSSALAERSSTNLIESIPALVPGVTLARLNSATPNNFFAIRGGFYESRINIDGHPLSSGTFGSWNTNYANPYTFGNIEVTRGPGGFGALAGESVFGTLNLETRDFTPNNSFSSTTGVDSYGGQYSSFVASVNALQHGRLSFLAMHNYTGYNGPNQSSVVARPNATNTLVNYVADFSSPYRLTSDVLKARYHFSDTTSLTLAFIGLGGQYEPQGGAYGTYQGTHVIPACQPNPSACTLFSTYNAPSAANLIGKNLPLYAFSDNSILQNYQPLYEAELRTAIGNDTVLVRPYQTTLSRFIDGSGRPFQPGFSGSWYKITDGTRCSGATTAPNAKTGTPASGPCYQGSSVVPYTAATNACSAANPCYAPTTVVANNGGIGYAAPFATLEIDTLHGVTFSYLHPFRDDDTLLFTYDYHSDATQSYSGDNTPLLSTTPLTLATTPISILPTVSRNNDLGVQTNIGLGRGVRLDAGAFLTNWGLHYEYEDPALFAASQRGAAISLISSTRSYSHLDPQIGLTYRPSQNTILRLSGGSAITIPFAGQLSGFPAIDFPNAVNNFTGTVTLRNPDLQPETSIAYDLGSDVRLRNGGVATLDLFSNTVHNVFLADRVPYTGPAIAGGGTYFQSVTVNGPLLRSYGVEFSLTNLPALGFGYLANATMQRTFYDQLPAAFFATQQTSIVNGKQLDGTPAIIPYSTAAAQLQFAAKHDFLAVFGAHYVGSNNAYFGPAVTLFNASLRRSVGPGLALAVSVDNLSNYSTGVQLGQGTTGLGFAQITYGTPAGATAPSYGRLVTSLQTIQPRTARIELQAHVR